MRPMMMMLALLACHGVEETPHTTPTEALPPSAPSLALDATGILPGAPASFTVQGLQPGERAVLLRSGAPSPSGACPTQLGGLCLDIAGPLWVLGTAVADLTGTARLTLNVPASLPTGRTVALQAVVVRGSGGSQSAKSPAVVRVTGATPADHLSPGDLVITELLHDPTAVDDAVGEWLEVVNLRAGSVDLGGLVVTDAAGVAFTVPGPWVVGAGARMVLGAFDDPAVNGGVPVDLAWAGLALDDVGAVVLSSAAGVLDALAWDGGATFPAAPGRPLSLDPTRTSAVANDDGAAWCAGPPGGTPGVDNLSCPGTECGDGRLDAGEACDDGATVPGDGCDASCDLESCPVPPRITGVWHISGLPGPARSVARLADGALLVGGSVAVAGDTEGWVARVEADGEVSWAEGLDDRRSDNPVAGLVPRGDGGAWVLTEAWMGYPDNTLFGLTHLAADGAVLTARAAGAGRATSGDLYDLANGAVPAGDGGVYAWGRTEDTLSSTVAPFAAFKRFAADGSLQWQKTWEELGSGGTPTVVGAAPVPGGGVIVGGAYPALQGFAGDGTRLWRQRFTSTMEVLDLAPTADGHVLLALRWGSNRSPALTKLAPDGSVVWSRSMNVSGVSPTSELHVAATPAVCDAAAAPGAVCAVDGAVCATAAQICRCDGTWTCEAGAQTYALAWVDNATSGSVPATVHGALSTFDVAGGVLASRSFDGFDDWIELGADGDGFFGAAPLGLAMAVVRVAADLGGACDATTLGGLSWSSTAPGLTGSVGPWDVTTARRDVAWYMDAFPVGLPSSSEDCAASECAW